MRDSPLACGDVESRAAVGWRWFETLLLTAAVPLGRSAAGSADPFALGGSFPWLVFVPFVIGLKHGFRCAAASVVAMLSAAVVHADRAGISLPPATVGFACGALVLVASRACDAQRERCERLRMRVLQLERAWEREKRAREVLRASHADLAQRVQDASRTLDGVVDSVARRLVTVRGVSEFGRFVLGALSQRAELQEGSVWLECGGRCLEVASTRSGRRGPRKMSSLVQLAVRKRSVVSLLEEALVDDGVGDEDGGLAALPLSAADGTTRGAVLIEQMPFESFDADQLHQMNVLLRAIVAPLEAEKWNSWIVEATQLASSERAARSDPASGAARWDAIA